MKTDHRNRLQSLSLTWENMQRATAMQFATKMKIRQQWDVLYKLIHNLSLTSHPSEPIRYQTEVMQYMTIAWEEGMDASIEIPPLPRYHLFGWVHNDPNLYQRYQFQVFPMKYKSDAPNTLIQFMQDVRNPCVLYGATELTQGRMSEIWIDATQSEAYSQWQMKAEFGRQRIEEG